MKWILLLLSLFWGCFAVMNITMEPPSLVGASNNSATHYWFPTDMAVIFNESHFLIDARLADDCGDYFCNKTGQCHPTDPSHQISMTSDGGSSFNPLYEVGGHSPWSKEASTRPFLGPCVLALDDITRLVLYQGRIWADTSWTSPAALFSLDPKSGLRWELATDLVSYEGADKVCGGADGHMWNQGVIKTDGGWILTAQCDTRQGVRRQRKGGDKISLLLVFSSQDGYRWKLVGPGVPAVAPDGEPACESPGENTLVELQPDGWLLVSRCGDGQPLLGWVSTDRGLSWKRHKLPSSMHGVMPVAVRMDNGAIVLVTGRGGLAMWLNAQGDGRDWVLTNLAEKHNELILQNKKLNGTSLQYSDAFVAFNQTRESTSYNTLRKLGSNNGVVCYDWLATSCPKEGDPKRNDHLFCMRFYVNGTN